MESSTVSALKSRFFCLCTCLRASASLCPSDWLQMIYFYLSCGSFSPLSNPLDSPDQQEACLFSPLSQGLEKPCYQSHLTASTSSTPVAALNRRFFNSDAPEAALRHEKNKIYNTHFFSSILRCAHNAGGAASQDLRRCTLFEHARLC